MEGIIYYEQAKLTGDSADLEHQQIREQQVQLRLQQNQGEIMRQQELRQVLANEQVEMGFRNIAGPSGTIRAITQLNFSNYLQDKNADTLNYLGKQRALELQNRMVDLHARSQYISETAGFMKQMEDNFAKAFSGGMGGVGGPSASGGALQSSSPSGSLLDYSGTPNMNLNG